MRDDFSDITIVLDRSGSMEAVADDTIGGFNRFLLDQKQAPGDGVLTLVQFDNEYEFVHTAVPLKEVPPLSRKTFVPNARTSSPRGTARPDSRWVTGIPRRASATAAMHPDGPLPMTMTRRSSLIRFRLPACGDGGFGLGWRLNRTAGLEDR